MTRTTVHELYLQDKARIYNIPGFSSLPRVLVPRAKSQRKPPVMHYGWPLSESNIEFLVHFATQHGVARYFTMFDEESTEFDDEGLPPLIQIVDERRSAAFAIYSIVDSINDTPVPRTVSLRRYATAEDAPIVSMCTNYTLREAPTEEFKKILCAKLQISGEPQWYLDAQDWQWRPRMPESMKDGHHITLF